MTACYEASFNYYGAAGSPRRTGCPKDATPITPPPEPGPEIVIPDGADGLVERVLAGAVQEGLRRAAGGDPARHRSVPPPAGVATDGADIGVALFEPDGRACLLGART